MKINLLELEQCRVNNLVKSLSNNSYSNPTLEEYQKKIFILFQSISNTIEELKDKYDTTTHIFCQDCLDFISGRTQFLEGSTLNTIPFETIFCLEKALNDWVKEGDSFTFVTSLVQKDEYSFSPDLQTDAFFKNIINRYDIHFNKDLIQISIPKYQVNDYFFNIALYHELGHFVDLYWGISESIAYDKYLDLWENDLDEFDKKLMHLREHFADLFSAQYINDCFINFLEHLAPFDGDCDTHPATNTRIDIIQDFLDGESNEVIETFQKVVVQKTGDKLSIKFEMPEIEDFFEYLPPKIKSDKELHGIFSASWQIWTNRLSEFPEKDSRKLYIYINNLIEKSISNYMIESIWENVSEPREAQ